MGQQRRMYFCGACCCFFCVPRVSEGWSVLGVEEFGLSRVSSRVLYEGMGHPL